MARNYGLPTEQEEQIALFRWAQAYSMIEPALELLHHIPNGGSRNKLEAANLKREGVKAGVPDICLPVARRGYHGLYIELKRTAGSRVQDTQKQWLHALNDQEYFAALCRGHDEAISLIVWYLGMEEKNE